MTLDECLAAYTVNESLPDANDPLDKRLTFDTNKIAIFHLKRFTNGMKKIKTTVKIPEQINLNLFGSNTNEDKSKFVFYYRAFVSLYLIFFSS